MSHSNSTRMNKKLKHSKKFFEQYLYNSQEPSEHLYSYTSAELEAELLEHSLDMKQRFRNNARRLRSSYL